MIQCATMVSKGEIPTAHRQMKTALTDAQVRVMMAIRRSGRVPSNTTVPLLHRLAAKGFIKHLHIFDEQGKLIVPNRKPDQMELTEEGEKALAQVEAAQACHDLAARLSGILS